MAEELWRHPDPTGTPMWRFLQRVNEKYALKLEDYQGLYKWSVDNVGLFWEECWDFVGVQADVQGKVRLGLFHVVRVGGTPRRITDDLHVGVMRCP